VDDEVFVPLANGNVSVISASNDTVVRSIALGPGELFAAVYGVSPGRVYVSDLNGSSIDVIDAANGTLLDRISVDAQPSLLTVASDRARLYIGAYGGDRLDVVNTMNDSVIARIPVDHNPFEAAYDPVEGRILVGAANGHNVTVVNATDDQVIARIPLNSSVGLVYDPIGGSVWATIQNSPQVALLDPANLTVAGRMFAGHGPSGLACDPGTGRLAVVGVLSNQVTMLPSYSTQRTPI
jgi:YVTN family beta-propeller protein